MKPGYSFWASVFVWVGLLCWNMAAFSTSDALAAGGPHPGGGHVGGSSWWHSGNVGRDWQPYYMATGNSITVATRSAA